VIHVPERDETARVTGWVSSKIEITGNKALTEEKEQLERIAADMAIGIWHLDKRSKSVTWTKQLEEIYGLEASQVNSYDEFRRLVHPDDVEMLEKLRDDAIRARKPMQFEFRIVRPGGEVRWVIGAGRVFYDEATGEPVRTIGTNFDITERKRIEQEAEFQRKELAHLMRVAMLGGLSGGIAHELSQPLVSILTNAEAAQALLAQRNPDLKEIASILDDIIEEDRRAGQIIHHLRNLFRNKERESIPVSLNEVISSALDLIHPELAARNIVVQEQLDDALPLILGDSVQLQQVFLNLMLNAMDAMASIATSERAISIVTRRAENGELEAIVRDQGPGMSPDELRRCNQPFFTTKDEGLGLGLSISSMIVVSHGGRLNLENATGGGLVATVSLPAPS
jgi:PAS domain S-box-containing protein